MDDTATIIAVTWSVAGLLALHLACYISFRWAHFPSPSMLAFQAVCFVACSYFGVFGCWLWWVEPTPVDRVHGHSDGCYHIAVNMVAFQLWDAAISAILPKLRSPEMIAHHLVTAALAYFVTSDFLCYYAIYFLGVAELSNVSLTVVDIFKNVPQWQDRFSSINTAGRISFVLFFLALRVVGWPMVSYSFWCDTIPLLMGNDAQEQTPKPIIGFFLLANVFLTGLQILWASKLVRFLGNTFRGKQTKPKRSS